jgi:flagellar hook-basal body complex protein FliE
MPTRAMSRQMVGTIDEVTLDDLLIAIRNKVTVLQEHMKRTRDAEHEFMRYILNACQQVAQRLHAAEALLQAFVEYAQTLGVQDPTLNRLVTEATQFLGEAKR